MMNIFVKPDEQNDARIDYAMARKGRIESLNPEYNHGNMVKYS